VRRDDFCRLQAQLTNTAMALLLAQRRQADKLARAWGLPTREEADALQRQIRELKQALGERTAQPTPRGTPRQAAARPKATRHPKPKSAGGRPRGSSARRERR
jgi:poly(hydroxyalkanoate) synthase III subunit E